MLLVTRTAPLWRLVFATVRGLFTVRYAASGEIAGEQPQGLAQMFVSKVVSQTPVESITVYPTQELSSGAIVVRVD